MKKLFTLLTLLLCAVSGAWAVDYYTPTADEVIILNSIVNNDASSTGYSNHAAVAWAGKPSTSNKKAGDPDNDGAATSDNVGCYSVKGNGGAKNINLYIAGCSKIIVYHEKHAARYVELRSGNKSGTLIGKGAINTYYTEVDLDGSTDYNIFLHGTTGSDDQDFYVYAIKLIKAASGPVNPVFSLTTESTIAIGETSQIQVGTKGNLDGITLTGLTSSAPTVATVDGTGLITAVAAGTTTISFTGSNAVAEKYNATSTPQNFVLTVTAPQVKTPTITASGVFTESKTVEIACATEDATIKYSTNDGATWTDYTSALNFTETTTVKAYAVKAGYLDSETVSATYTKVVLDTQTDVTGNATWDWSKFGTGEIKLTDDTTPSKSDEFILSNVFAYGFTAAPVPAAFGDAKALKTTCEYAVRDSKYWQGGSIKFNTTVSGVVTVTYTNTGNRSSEDDRRFLNINGKNYGEGTMNTSDQIITTVPVTAGEVAIKGTLKKDGSDQYLRIYKIEFSTETTVEKTIAASGKSTFSSAAAVDFSGVTGLTAYTVSALSETSVTLTKVTEAPAATGLLLIGTAGETYNIPIVASAEAVGTNYLNAAVANKELAANSAYVLKNGLFHLVTKKGSITAGKAYLLAKDFPATAPESLTLDFDGADDITTGIENVEAQQSFLDGEFYNLAGQRVAQPTKGLYIVNGKKVVVK